MDKSIRPLPIFPIYFI